MAMVMSPMFASLNSLPTATKIPPRTYTIMAKRKYTPIAKNGKAPALRPEDEDEGGGGGRPAGLKRKETPKAKGA